MVAKTPPMGWNSWDCYGASVNEETVRANAKFMAENLKQYGWEYVVVDIQWSEPTANSHEYHKFTELETDGYSRLIPAPNRFPSSAGGKGFAPLAEYVHSLGLKFGIHIMRGIPRQAVHKNTPIKGTDITARQIAHPSSICYWNTDMYGIKADEPGAQSYYNSIFELYAEWGVDFVKVDDIANHYAKDEIELIYKAIQNSGCEMVLSISPGPTPYEHCEHLSQYVNMWRITDDFWDKWELLYDMFGRAETWHKEAREGHWPDCDMLPLGAILQDYNKENRTKFTPDEQMTMMSLWCTVRSPLMLGADMVYLENDSFTMSLLTNTELLKLHRASKNPRLLFRDKVVNKEHIAWYAESSANAGEYYIALFNAGEAEENITVDLNKHNIPVAQKMYDIWNKNETDIENGIISADVKPHGVRHFLIRNP